MNRSESRKSGAKVRRRTVAAVLATLATTLLPALAGAQTASIPLSTLPPAPTAGTLSNGVSFTVNVGSAHPTQGYVFFPSQSPQVWTFDVPISLRFGLRGLNLGGECFRVPAGAVPESVNPVHSWNPTTRLLCQAAGSGPESESVFTFAGPVTELLLEAINNSGGGRGPGFIEVTVNAGIELVKSATDPDPPAAGSMIDYSFLVTNIGDVDLSSVTVTDPLPGLPAIFCPATTLAAGESMTCTATYTVTQGDVDAGVVDNTATVTGDPPAAVPQVSDDDSATVELSQLPDVDLSKTGTGPDPLTVGSTIDYEFLVTNTGNVSLANLTVADPLPGLSPIICPGTSLAPGESMTCTASYTVTQADVDAGFVQNTATVTGDPPGGLPQVSDEDSTTVPPSQLPGIQIDKSGSGPDPLTVGATVIYSFVVVNTGNVSLTGVTVTDPLPGLSAIDCPGTSLLPGESMTCTASYTVTQADVDAGTVVNTATVTADPPGGLPQVSAEDSASVPPTQELGIAIDKSGTGPDPLVIGATVDYTFVVENTGNVTLTAVTVTDPLPGLSAIDCPGTVLAPGAQMTCTATYVVTQADAEAGVILNTATATGESSSGVVVSDQSSASVPPAPSSVLEVPTLSTTALLMLALLLSAAALVVLRRSGA